MTEMYDCLYHRYIYLLERLRDDWNDGLMK